MTTSAVKSLGSETLTQGIRIRVDPSFIESRSDARRGRFTFAYKIHMTNEGECSARLRSREWHVVDADGVQHDVNGPGVVGQHPSLAPGESFEYSSFCPLPTAWGTMEGHFVFERDDASSFDAQVSRFYFAAPA
ncbi:MAG: Co2+/Mg2+ efflux protein ApaG [Phycisphaerales bacterium]|nr:Co2+/Mg2+ efflux protein ApaG [Phycisphaerales bacterium]